MEKEKLLKQINIILFFIFWIVYFWLIKVFKMGSEIANWRYYLLIGIVAFSFVSLIIIKGIKNLSKKVYCGEIIFIIITAIIFLIISVFKANSSNVPVQTRTFVQIFLFLLPALYAFNLINILSTKTIIFLMKFCTISLIIVYFTEPRHLVTSFFDINNWMSINFIKSESFTESHDCAETFLQLFLFFAYFENIKDANINDKSLKFYKILTFVFTILSFKRLGVIFAIFIFLFSYFKKFDKNIRIKNNTSSILIAILITLATYMYIMFLEGKIFTDIDVFKFSSSRSWFLEMWREKDYLSYGYGSSLLIIGRYLEMDLVEIFIELNAFALLLFNYAFFRTAKQKIYTNMVLLYVFFNMLTSSTMPWTSSWIILMLLIFTISSEKYKDEALYNEKYN